MITPISITTQPGRLHLEHIPPRVDIERTPPGGDITRREPQVSTDASEYQEAVGVLMPDRLGKELSKKALTAASEGIARTASEGDQLMRIEEAASIATVAQARFAPPDAGELVLRAVPPVRRTVDPGGVSTRFIPGEVRITPHPGDVRFHYQPGRVTVDKEVPPRLNVQV